MARGGQSGSKRWKSPLGQLCLPIEATGCSFGSLGFGSPVSGNESGFLIKIVGSDFAKSFIFLRIG
jgi:hypothetical protein